MGSTAKALGLGPTFEFEGDAYELKPLTFDGQARIEVELERTARERVKRSARYQSAAEVKEQLAEVNMDIATGQYEWGSAAMSKFLHSLSGLKLVLRLQMKTADGRDVDEETVDRFLTAKMEEAAALLAEANDPGDSDPLGRRAAPVA